ncbi:hypothetical protein AM592_18800 [Bacillus gobiensis]|uniref:Uncharacterized protein n=1 Tax=Bacillus gobiensis TaxID=1441095 RepID=A0A0M4FTL0_9BACI|nr:hypothetical protein AM592_18800 [Bacillus gobiensis]
MITKSWNRSYDYSEALAAQCFLIFAEITIGRFITGLFIFIRTIVKHDKYCDGGLLKSLFGKPAEGVCTNQLSIPIRKLQKTE